MTSMSRIVRKAALGSLLLSVVALPACYHATVDTGRRPSGEVIERPWAPSFVYGLVPPATVETAQRCPNGVARVETQLSFLNSLVGGLTFGIFTPMHITVACAAPGTAMNATPDAERVITLRDGASVQELESALNAAAKRASRDDAPVYVDFSAMK